MADYLDFFNGYMIVFLQIFTGFYFLTRFLKKKVKPIYYLLSAVVGTGIIRGIFAGSTAGILVFVLLLAAGGIFVCHADWEPVILYVVLVVEIMQLCYGAVNSVLGMLFPLIFPHMKEAAGIIFIVLGNMALLAAVFCYRMVCRYFLYQESVKKRYLPTILIPVVMIFLMGEYISSIIYGNTVVTDGNIIVSGTNHYQMLVIQLLGLASLFCLMYAYRKLLENFHLLTQLSLLEQEEHTLARYVEEAKSRYEKTKAFRHDIKNHITVVKGLLQNGKAGQALNYIGDMEEMTEELSFLYSTSHPAADILIGTKLGHARNMGIDVHCSLHLPSPCPVRDIDFCIILSNALDNAVRACSSMDTGAEKYIRVTGNVQGDFILIEIENSFQGKGCIKEGTGLENIKAVAEKYHGAMNIKAGDGAFILNVLLIIPQHSQSIPQQIG